MPGFSICYCTLSVDLRISHKPYLIGRLIVGFCQTRIPLFHTARIVHPHLLSPLLLNQFIASLTVAYPAGFGII